MVQGPRRRTVGNSPEAMAMTRRAPRFRAQPLVTRLTQNSPNRVHRPWSRVSSFGRTYRLAREAIRLLLQGKPLLISTPSDHPRAIAHASGSCWKFIMSAGTLAQLAP